MKGFIFAAMLLAAANLIAAQTVPQVQRPQNTNAAVTRQQQEGQLQKPRAEGLSEEQRLKLREATEKSRQQQTELYERMRNVRTELDALTRVENYDESAITNKAQEIGKIEGELAVIRARQYKDLRGILPKGQFEQMHNGTSQPPAILQQRLNSIVARTNLPPNVRPLPPSTNRPALPVTPRK
jgi:Spy/CpxP family protein refolding chaperone